MQADLSTMQDQLEAAKEAEVWTSLIVRPVI